MDPAGIAASIDQNVISLLGSKTSRALLRLVPASELILTCCALAVASRAVPSRSPVLGRVSALMAKVLASIAFGAAFQWISGTQDAPLAITALLAVFFWTGALDPGNELSATAQYLLVSTLADKVQDSHALVAVSWALAFGSGHLVPKDAAMLAQLVTVESLSAWLTDWMPRSTLLPSTVGLLYLCAPFTHEFPLLTRLYRFAVFALTNDTDLARVPTWLVTGGLWALWQLETDPVSRRLASIAGASFATLSVLDAMRFAMDNDPAPTLLALAVVISILSGMPRA